MIKSGSDFRDFSEISVNFSLSRPPTFDIVRHTITREIAPDPDVAVLVKNYTASMEEMMKEQIGRFLPLSMYTSPFGLYSSCMVPRNFNVVAWSIDLGARTAVFMLIESFPLH